MAFDQDTEMGGDRRDFQSTHWSRIVCARKAEGEELRETLNYLIRRYWKPVYCFVRRHGLSNEDAKDHTQAFFVNCLQKELFAMADPKRGRFRTFLLSCLRNFMLNSIRDEKAGIRHPPGGFVSIHELATDNDIPVEADGHTSPDETFHTVWVGELVRRTLRLLEKECNLTGKELHYEFFQLRVIAPMLDGAEQPSLRELGERFHVSPKEVSNRVITARRAFQKLLRQEIRDYARSEEDVATEMRELLSYLQGT